MQQQQQRQRRRAAVLVRARVFASAERFLLFLLPRERDESIYFCIPTICYATPLKISRTLPRARNTSG